MAVTVSKLRADAPQYVYHGNLQLPPPPHPCHETAMGCCPLPPPPPPPHHKTAMGGGPLYHAAALPTTFPVFASYPPPPPPFVPAPAPICSFPQPPQPALRGHFHFAPPSVLRLTASQRRLGKVAPSPLRPAAPQRRVVKVTPSPLRPTAPQCLLGKVPPSLLRPAVPGCFLGKVALSAAPPQAAEETFQGKDAPSPPLPAAPVPLSTEAVPSSPAPTTPVPPSLTAPKVSARPHGLPPHRLMFWSVDVDTEKKQAQAQATAIAGEAQPVKPRGRKAGPRLMQARHRETGTRRSRELWRRQAKAAPAEVACKPAFTTRPPTPRPAPEWRNPQVTTVMIRNIPNRLKPAEMMQLLDDHCACANKEEKPGGDVPAAYDFLYLPMDFSLCSNLGYAFVNLTSAHAARGLHSALHGARWTVFGTNKVIDIRAARIQGKKALVKHFSNSTFPCATDDFLPAVFSPPRDGEATATAMRVGIRVTPVVTPVATQRLAGKPAVRGRRQRWVAKPSGATGRV
ncbi:protein MEI2-like 7 [Hordeum vulgare subsp. vulgare]|uniref:Mei2-like C-terminal RNA recognition motif domain-containing protein n=1 Tax=Hordeum vulgare subsp. vulgare TaxID=112509 RepID=A0A8I6Z049_HORVV|nr:protein MEI2-like 7 [Hordeum vulgare subsp. vulgare]